jgi:chaperonin GroES
MNGKAIAGKLIVEVISGPGQTKSGFIIPESAKAKETRARIISIGAKTPDASMDGLKVGYEVIISIHSGIKFQNDDKTYKRIGYEDVLMIFET